MPAEQDSMGEEFDSWVAAMPAGVDPQVEAARQRIGRISRQFERVLNRVVAGQELTVGDLAALSALHRSPTPGVRTPTQLADALGLTSGTVSVRIERLIRAGLVEPVDAADGRSRPIRLTRKGRQRWAAATRSRTEDERRLFTDALAERQLAQLNELLRTLLRQFEAEFGPTSPHDTVR